MILLKVISNYNKFNIKLTNHHNSFSQSIMTDFAFIEDEQYEFALENIGDCVPLELQINDKLINLMQVGNSYITQSELFFLNNYDLVLFSLKVLINNQIVIFTSNYITILTRSFSADFTRHMLSELDTLTNNFITLCFNHSVSKVINSQNITLTKIETFLECTEKIIQVYQNRIQDFKLRPHIQIKQENKLLDIHSIKQINSEGFYWLTHNPSVFKKTQLPVGIKIDESYYMPTKAMSVVTHNHTDTYENRSIVNALIFIFNTTKNLKQNLQNIIIKELVKITIEYPIPKFYEIPYNILYETKRVYYDSLINSCDNLLNNLSSLISHYKEILPCTHFTNISTIRNTQVFSHMPHYKNIFETIMLWLQNCNYNLTSTQYLFKLKTIDKIYEYFCLTRILKSLISIEYECTDTQIITYTQSEPTNELFNYYELTSKHSNIVIRLYYEPIIMNSPSNANSLPLYTNSSSLSKQPDFVFEFFDSESNQQYFGIFDSKYAKYYWVKENLLPEIVFKYAHELSSINSNYLPLLFIYVLHPGFEYNEKCDIYTINKGHRNYPTPLPSMGYIHLAPNSSIRELSYFFEEQLNIFKKIIS